MTESAPVNCLRCLRHSCQTQDIILVLVLLFHTDLQVRISCNFHDYKVFFACFDIILLKTNYSGVQFTLTPLSLSEGNSHLSHMSRMGQGDIYDDRDDIRDDREGHDESRDSESPISDVEITS